jgi:hypothetical protein
MRSYDESGGATVYDQSWLLVVSAPAAGEIVGPITSGTPISLPGSQTYTGSELKVFLNGNSLEYVVDFSYVGSGARTQISVTFDLVVGDRLRFRIG